MLRRDPADLASRPLINRDPNTLPNNLPKSLAVYGPARLDPSTETASQWSPFGTFYPQPYHGGHDSLSLEGHGMMAVAQADTYDSSPNGWPQNPVYDHPNAIGMVGIMRLRPSGSAHHGFAMPTKRGDPSSLFHVPPIFGLQTKPIPAVGI